MEITVTPTRLFVTVGTNEHWEDMDCFEEVLAEAAEENDWECGPSLEWYEGDEETEPYYYLLWGVIEYPIIENMRYEFLMECGEILGTYPL